MRGAANGEKIRLFMKRLGREVRGPGRVYLTGGTSAVLVGWRDSTVDADLKLDPEPPGAFEALARLKGELDLNIELASPDDFVPAPPDWRERSTFIERVGEVDFFHFDFRTQALAKIERGHDRDLRDVDAMLARGLVDVDAIVSAFETAEPRLVRYPSLDAGAFRAKVEAYADRARSGREE